MQQYKNLVNHVLQYGVQTEDRTGTGCLSVFGYESRYKMSDGFPLMTTKKIHLKSVIHELLWFIRGDTNINYLKSHGVRIWDEWADANGDLGPVYGKQWRDVNGYDQLQSVIDEIKTNPNSRRLIINAWNVDELPNMKLPPCHYSLQFYCRNDKLSLKVIQRSADVFLGVPFNIASYALLLHFVAIVTGKEAYELIHSLGDAHIYNNHIEQVKTQMGRAVYDLPKIKIKHRDNINDFVFDDIEIINYNCHPTLSGKVAI